MRDLHPLAIPAAVAAAFGLILAAMFVVEQVRPVGKQAEVKAIAAPAPPLQPPPKPATDTADVEMKEREIKAEIDRLTFDLDGYRRDLDVAERREREHAERFKRASLQQKGSLMGEGVRLGSESLKAGKKVRDTEYRIRQKHRELQDLYKKTE